MIVQESVGRPQASSMPRVPPLTPPEPLYAAYLEALRVAGFEGDITERDGGRAAAAFDNSIYEMLPQAIVYPRGKADVKHLMALLDDPRFRAVRIAGRGGGTGTNGQALTQGMVVDFTRYMNRILEIDPDRGIARVEPGVVKDQLNRALGPHGLFFAPELSTSDRATIGGMISTDASGQGSVRYGKTRNHVCELTTVFLGGTEFRSAPLDAGALAEVRNRSDRIGTLHRFADDLESSRREEIMLRFPQLNRSLTGYDLANLRDGRGRFDLNSLICGAEGTLGLVVEAELSVLPRPAEVGLLLLGYDDVRTALEAPGTLLEIGASSVEFMDQNIVELARKDPVWSSVGHLFGSHNAEHLGAVNILEFLADTPQELTKKMLAAREVLSHDNVRATILCEVHGADGAELVWSMRKRAVGLLGNLPGNGRPVAFVEDAAVPPERLAEFIDGFRAILDRKGLRYGMFGHADAGVVHVRPALDMRAHEAPTQVREISDAVAALVRRYGGVLWGEHGKGVRSEYAPEVFGSLYGSMCEIKRICDPHGQINPGKIASPDGGALHPIDTVPMRGQLSAAIPQELLDKNGSAMRCNGNGACHSFDVDMVMCPSWRGTRDRRHTPKGRANLMERWLRGYVAAGGDTAAIEEPYGAAPRRYGRLGLAANAIKDRRGRSDFSHEVWEAMDGCLSCNGCSGQCPVKVDVPQFRAAFLQAYYSRYPRPLSDLVVQNLEWLLPKLARFGPLTARLLRSRLTELAGFTDLPNLPRHDLARRARQRDINLRPAKAAGLDHAGAGVILVQDVFTTIFEPDLVLDSVELLERLGFQVFLTPLLQNGKPLHVRGMLSEFTAVARKTAERLRHLAKSGLPMVGLDPSMTLVYRREYCDALGPNAAPRVQLLQEWLAASTFEPTVPPRSTPPAVLLPHCTERAIAPEEMNLWKTVFDRFGMPVEVLEVGCCGMAGLYGHEQRHRATSARIFDLSWRPKLEAKLGSFIATGYSCRTQALREAGKTLRHPVSHLLAETREGAVKEQ